MTRKTFQIPQLSCDPKALSAVNTVCFLTKSKIRNLNLQTGELIMGKMQTSCGQENCILNISGAKLKIERQTIHGQPDS